MQNINLARSSIGTGPRAILAGLGERFRRYRLYRTTLAELRGLNDRELADLGLHRSLIRSVAYRAAYHD